MPQLIFCEGDMTMSVGDFGQELRLSVVRAQGAAFRAF